MIGLNRSFFSRVVLCLFGVIILMASVMDYKWTRESKKQKVSHQADLESTCNGHVNAGFEDGTTNLQQAVTSSTDENNIYGEITTEGASQKTMPSVSMEQEMTSFKGPTQEGPSTVVTSGVDTERNTQNSVFSGRVGSYLAETVANNHIIPGTTTYSLSQEQKNSPTKTIKGVYGFWSESYIQCTHTICRWFSY